jgi:hypothetical protein
MIRKHGNPIRGVRDAKPKLPDNGKPPSKEEFAELSREYLETRNRQDARQGVHGGNDGG